MKKLMENWNKFVNEETKERRNERFLFQEPRNRTIGAGGVIMTMPAYPEKYPDIMKGIEKLKKSNLNLEIFVNKEKMSNYRPGELLVVTTKGNRLANEFPTSRDLFADRFGILTPQSIMQKIAPILSEFGVVYYNREPFYPDETPDNLARAQLDKSRSKEKDGAKDGVKGDAQAATNAIVSSGIAKKVEDYEIPKGPAHRVYGLEQEFIQMFPDGIVGIEISDPRMPNWKKDPIQIVYQGHDGKNHYFKFPDGDNYFMVTKK
jgi:hypothetical protein